MSVKNPHQLFQSARDFATKINGVSTLGKYATILEAAVEFEKTAAGGSFIFPSDHSRVTDGQNHFPINNEAHGRNALARASQFKKAPKWFMGSLDSFVNTVRKAVHKKFPGIELSDKSKNPGKG